MGGEVILLESLLPVFQQMLYYMGVGVLTAFVWLFYVLSDGMGQSYIN